MADAKKPLKPGDTCYSQHGEEAILVAQSGGEFIVRPLFEDDYGSQEGDIQTWTAAFRTPPAPKLDAQTKDAEEKLHAIRVEVDQLRSERMAMDVEHKARLDRIKKHADLEMLDRYLAGEITHYVAKHDYCPRVEIIPLGATIEQYASSDGYGLLTLRPSRNWDKRITFSLYFRDQNRDRYTSSRTAHVVPCCGEDQARAKATEIVTAMVVEYLALAPERRSYIEQLFASCAQFGVEIPERLVSENAELSRKNLQQQRDKAAQSLSEIEAKLQALSATGSAQ